MLINILLFVIIIVLRNMNAILSFILIQLIKSKDFYYYPALHLFYFHHKSSFFLMLALFVTLI